MNVLKKIEGVLIVFTLATRVTELGELQSETSDRDPCSSLGTESAWPIWGVPSLPTCALAFPLSDSIGSGGRLVSQRRFHFWSPQVRPGKQEPPACDGASVPVPIVW